VVLVDQMWSDDEEVTAVGPGENVKIKLKGIEEDDVSPGFVLCDNANPIKTGRVFDAQVRKMLHLHGLYLQHPSCYVDDLFQSCFSYVVRLVYVLIFSVCFIRL